MNRIGMVYGHSLLFSLMFVMLIFMLMLMRVKGEEINSNQTKILLFIPGMDFQSNRYRIILSNLQYLQNTSIAMNCLIFSYQPPLNKSDEIEIRKFCELEYFFHGNYGTYIKSLIPFLLIESGYTHVFLLLDDVQLNKSFRLEELVKIMKRNNLQVISPGIINASMTSTTPYKLSTTASKLRRFKPRYTLGHFAEVIEIFATLFTIEGWKCWWEMIQPTLNPSGWGYDLCFSVFCPSLAHSFGVVDNQTAIHRKDLGRLTINTAGLARQSLQILHPGAQKEFWIETVSTLQNHSITCKDIERHSRGKPLQ